MGIAGSPAGVSERVRLPPQPARQPARRVPDAARSEHRPPARDLPAGHRSSRLTSNGTKPVCTTRLSLAPNQPRPSVGRQHSAVDSRIGDAASRAEHRPPANLTEYWTHGCAENYVAELTYDGTLFFFDDDLDTGVVTTSLLGWLSGQNDYLAFSRRALARHLRPPRSPERGSRIDGGGSGLLGVRGRQAVAALSRQAARTAGNPKSETPATAIYPLAAGGGQQDQQPASLLLPCQARARQC
jgi:hypothetical protein